MIPPDGVNYGVAWVYFNHKEKTSQTTTALICSLAQQLIRGLSRIPDAIQDIFQRLLDVKTSLSLLESRRAFHAALASFNRAFIVVDALDECDEDRTRASFLSELRPVLSRIQLMVTSRHVASIEQDFQDALRIDVLAHRQDLDRYISSRLKSEKRLNQHVQGDTKLEKLIKDTLIEKSQGM